MSVSVWARVSFQASVEPEQVELGEHLVLNLQIESSDPLDQVGAPTFDAHGFDVLDQVPTSSFESTNINGQVQRKYQKTIRVYLQPRKVGVFRIQNISIRISGKRFVAKALSVRVVKGSHAASQPGATQMRRARSNSDTQQGHLFLKAEASQHSVYLGQQVVVSYYLYQDTSIQGYEVTRFPLLKGALKETLFIASGGRGAVSQTVRVGERTYRRILLARYALYPLREGKLTIDPIAVQVQFLEKSKSTSFSFPFGDDEGSIFSQFFQTTLPKVKRMHSRSLSIAVQPLPQNGKPKNFSGAVGVFSIRREPFTLRGAVGRPLTVRIIVSGEGNTGSVELPLISWPSIFEVYPPKVQTHLSREGKGEKTFEFILVPQSGGDVEMAPVVLSYFNPSSKQYRVTQTQPWNFHILGEKKAVLKNKEQAQVGSLNPYEKTQEGINNEVGEAAVVTDRFVLPFHGPIQTSVFDRIFRIFQKSLFLLWAWLFLKIAIQWFQKRQQLFRGSFSSKYKSFLKEKNALEQEGKKLFKKRLSQKSWSWILRFRNFLDQLSEEVFGFGFRVLSREHFFEKLEEKNGVFQKKDREILNQFLKDLDLFSYGSFDAKQRLQLFSKWYLKRKVLLDLFWKRFCMKKRERKGH